jgi:serine/threonine-protein kinase
MFAKGLAEYRQSHFEDALTTMQGKAATVMGPCPGIVRAMALSRLGQEKEARKELASAIASFNWYPNEADIRDRWVFHILRREAEAMILPNLPAFLEGKYQPLDNDERLAMLGACQFKQRFALIAGLYAEAFAADPSLDESLKTGRRYIAAQAAAQAASTQDAEHLTPEEQNKWRERSRQLLLADLAVLGTILTDAKPQDREKIRQFIRQVMQFWRLDKQLAGVRDQEELNKLSAEEREKCLAVWTEADTLLRRAEDAK